MLTATSSASRTRSSPPSNLVNGQELTICDIVWISPQSHISLSVKPHFLRHALQWLWPVKYAWQSVTKTNKLTEVHWLYRGDARSHREAVAWRLSATDSASDHLHSTSKKANIKSVGKVKIKVLYSPGAQVGCSSHLLGIMPVGGYTTESVTHGQCDTRPTVTFPAI